MAFKNFKYRPIDLLSILRDEISTYIFC